MTRYYTVNEIAESLKVNQRTVRRWIAQNRLKCTRIPSGLRISQEQIDDMLKNFNGTPPAIDQGLKAGLARHGLGV